MDFLDPIENEEKYYLSYAIILKDGGEVLATSEYVPAVSSITRITLNRDLSKGEYDAIPRVQPCRMDGTLTNNAEMEISLKAEEKAEKKS